LPGSFCSRFLPFCCCCWSRALAEGFSQPRQGCHDHGSSALNKAAGTPLTPCYQPALSAVTCSSSSGSFQHTPNLLDAGDPANAARGGSNTAAGRCTPVAAFPFSPAQGHSWLPFPRLFIPRLLFPVPLSGSSALLPQTCPMLQCLDVWQRLRGWKL